MTTGDSPLIDWSKSWEREEADKVRAERDALRREVAGKRESLDWVTCERDELKARVAALEAAIDWSLADADLVWEIVPNNVRTQVRESVIRLSKPTQSTPVTGPETPAEASKAQFVCDLKYAGWANALADCKRCGWPISRHFMVDDSLLNTKGPFAPSTSEPRAEDRP